MSAELAKSTLDVREIGTDYKYGFRDKEDYIFKSGRGLTTEIVTYISKTKNEPQWMLDFRLKALDIFRKKPMPKFGNVKLLEDIDFQNIFYYIKPSEKGVRIGMKYQKVSNKLLIAWVFLKRSASF